MSQINSDSGAASRLMKKNAIGTAPYLGRKGEIDRGANRSDRGNKRTAAAADAMDRLVPTTLAAFRYLQALRPSANSS